MIVGVMPICSALLTLRMALWVTSAHHSSDPGSSTEKSFGTSIKISIRNEAQELKLAKKYLKGWTKLDNH